VHTWSSRRKAKSLGSHKILDEGEEGMGMRERSGNYVKFFAYLIIVILINMAAITLFFRWDLTENKVFSISEASQQVVSTLSEPLTINVFFTSNLPAPYNNVEQYIRDLLKEYSIYANRYFNYRFYNVSAEEGDIDHEAEKNQELANSYGIYPIQVQTVEKDEVKFQKAYMGLVMIHGDIIERLPTITSTDGLEYQLTTGIRKLNNKVGALLRLPGKIKIRLFLSSSLKDVAPLMRLNRLSEVPKELEKIVGELNKRSFGKLEFEYLDPTKDASLEKELKKYNIMKLRWPALSDGGIPAGSGSIGLVMEYGDRAVEIPLISVLRLPIIGTQYQMVNLNKMDEIINENLESLIDINQDLGYLADHGTLNLPGRSPMDPMGRSEREPLSNFRQLASQNYTIKPVHLKGGTISEGFNCLVIARPTENFSDYELFQIDQFLMRGKSLALFLDAFKEVMPPENMPAQYGRGLQYLPLDTGLSKLLEHYGIHIKQSFVLDESCFKQAMPQQLGGGEREIYFAPLIKSPYINKDLGFMQNIKGLVTFKVAPLELNEKRIKESGLKAYRVFSSSDKSWELSGNINLNPVFLSPPQSKDKMKSHPLAYILSGEFPSYFQGRPIPEKDVEEEKSKKEDKEKIDSKTGPEKKQGKELSKIRGEGEIIAKGKPGKIFLMACSEMLRNSLLDPTGRTPNATFLMNVLDSLNDREEIAAMRSKEQRFNPLQDTRPETKTFVKTFNIGVLPVLVVLFGLLVWFLRHSRKRRIQMIFQK
jgi:ABC-2 type transport system permease protein